VKEPDPEMFFQLRDLAGHRSLAELALTGRRPKKSRSPPRGPGLRVRREGPSISSKNAKVFQ
jgi:hypothetical protein